MRVRVYVCVCVCACVRVSVHLRVHVRVHVYTLLESAGHSNCSPVRHNPPSITLSQFSHG